jgi:hypothetical protein
LKTTVPAGVPVLGATALTVAVKITFEPVGDGFTEEANAIIDDAVKFTLAEVPIALPLMVPVMFAVAAAVAEVKVAVKVPFPLSITELRLPADAFNTGINPLTVKLTPLAFFSVTVIVEVLVPFAAMEVALAVITDFAAFAVKLPVILNVPLVPVLPVPA